jgi:large subunit ribosomal protein L7/L12
LHVSAVVRKGEGPIEAKVRDEQLTIAAEAVRSFDASTLSGGIPPKVDEIADLICALNLVEAMQLSEALKKKLGVPESFFGGAPTGAVGPAAPSASEAAPAAAAAPAPAAKEEKLTVDIRLKSFKPDVKIKVIKEVRALTNLGLKEVRDPR